jgi:hypothetical protein
VLIDGLGDVEHVINRRELFREVSVVRVFTGTHGLVLLDLVMVDI